MNAWIPATVVDESEIRPGGRKPLSGLTSHSYPSVPVPGASVSVCPEFSFETAVFRQNRSLAKVAGDLDRRRSRS